MAPAADPRSFPLATLSPSSLRLYLRCPERWRRRYLDRQREPATANMLVGAAAGAAEREHFHRTIDGAPLSTDDVLDRYADEFELGRERGDVDWQGEPPGKAKDSGSAAVRVYHDTAAQQLVPVTAERRFELRFDGAPWALIGYVDLESLPGRLEPGQLPPPPGEPGTSVDDLKFSGKRWTSGVGPKPKRGEPDDRPRQVKADTQIDLQAGLYLAARRAEGNPAAGFRFHVTTRAATPVVEMIELQLTDQQLDAHLRRVWELAGEISWRIEHDQWHGAPPGAWWCAPNTCSFWKSCRFGGRSAATAAATVRKGPA